MESFFAYTFFSKEGGRGIKSASYTWYLSLATPGLHVSLEVLTHIAVLSRVYCADSKRSVTSLSASQQLCKIVFFVCFFVSIHYLRRLFATRNFAVHMQRQSRLHATLLVFTCKTNILVCGAIVKSCTYISPVPPNQHKDPSCLW